jgi:hypothetical protein
MSNINFADAVREAMQMADKPQEEQQEEIDAPINNEPTQEENTPNTEDNIEIEHKEEKSEANEETTEEEPTKEKTETRSKKPSYILGEYAQSYDSWNQEAKDYIARREKDIAAGFHKRDEEREFGKRAKNIFKEYDTYFQELGVQDPLQVIEPLLQHERVLRRGTPYAKQQALTSIANSYGIDIQSLVTAPQQVQNNIVPDELHTLRHELQALKQAQEQQQFMPLKQEMESFIESNPILKNPEVEAAVANIIQFNEKEYRGKKPVDILADATDRALAMLRITKPSAPPPAVNKSAQDLERAKKAAVSPKATSAGSAFQEDLPKFSSNAEALRYVMNQKR